MPALRIGNADRFRTLTHRAFEDEMVVHLGGVSAGLARAADGAGVRAMIRLGIARAREHAITLRGPVRLYLELMVLLGSYFDSDPQYLWAPQILAERDAGDPLGCAKRLFGCATDYLDDVHGPDGGYRVRALARLRAMTLRGPCDPGPVPASPSEDRVISGMLGLIAELHPERAAHVGRSGLESLIRSGLLDARFCGVATPNGTALLIALMFSLGHGCTEDPQHTWISETLSDPGLTGPEARVRALEARTLEYLEHVELHCAGAGGRMTRRTRPSLSHPHSCPADAMPWDSVVQLGPLSTFECVPSRD